DPPRPTYYLTLRALAPGRTEHVSSDLVVDHGDVVRVAANRVVDREARSCLIARGHGAGITGTFCKLQQYIIAIVRERHGERDGISAGCCRERHRERPTVDRAWTIEKQIGTLGRSDVRSRASHHLEC